MVAGCESQPCRQSPPSAGVAGATVRRRWRAETAAVVVVLACTVAVAAGGSSSSRPPSAVAAAAATAVADVQCEGGAETWRAQVKQLLYEINFRTFFGWVNQHRAALLTLLGVFWTLCIALGSWTMLRLPILSLLSLSLVVEFQLYWAVRMAIYVTEALPKVRFLHPLIPIPIPRWSWDKQRRMLRDAMGRAQDYETWATLAGQMDELHGRAEWKERPESKEYHWRIVRAAIYRLRRARLDGDVAGVMENLKPCMVKNFGGSMNASLYAQTHVGTKALVDALTEEIRLSVEWLMSAEVPSTFWGLGSSSSSSTTTTGTSSNGGGGASGSCGGGLANGRGAGGYVGPVTRRRSLQSAKSLPDCGAPKSLTNGKAKGPRPVLTPELEGLRLEFFRQAKRSFGNTALLLSGGATLGLYHIGVLRALSNTDCFPRVVCGTSAGAVLAGYLAVRTDEEVNASLNQDGLEDWWKQFGPNGPFYGSKLWKIQQVLTKGIIYDYDDFLKSLEWFCGTDVTFAEAFKRTNRLVSITCTPKKTKGTKGSPPLILNHFTVPNVIIASAVCASSCVPMLIETRPLMQKDPDGTIRPYEPHVARSEEAQVDGLFEQEEPGPISDEQRWFPDQPSLVRRDSWWNDEEEMSMEQILMRDGSFESDVPVQAISELFNCHFCIVSQVNPHIIPFFFHNRGRDGRPVTWRLWAGGWRGGFVLSALELWLKEDMLKNLRVLARLELLIEVFGVDWSYLWLQEAQGDVTLIPDIRFSDYLGIIDNMTQRSELHRKANSMEKNTWQCMSRIRNRMIVQNALDRACDALGITAH